MAAVTEPIALDRSLNTTESPSRNLADVLAQSLQALTTVVSGLNFINAVVVAELPSVGISTTTIYLVPSDNPQSENIYDEYINLDGTSAGWEKIGSTEIDLSNYYTKTETDTLLNGKVDKTDNVLSYGAMLSTTDGRNYKITVSSMDASRFSFMILVGSQSSAVAIIQCAVNNSGGANSIAFSDARATYDQGTKIITVDAGANAWTAPNVIYPKSRIIFS